MIRFRTAILLIGSVFFANVIALVFDWYHAFEWLDVPMHFFGGYVIALLGLAIYSWINERVEIRLRTHPESRFALIALEGLVIVGFVMIVGVAWEIWEFSMDQFATTFVDRFGVTQPGIADTMDDLFNDGVGAVTAWMFWREKT